MGIARAMIKLLMREGKREKFSGKVLTAGRQDVYSTAESLEKWAKEMDFKLRPGVQMDLNENEFFRKKGYISDNALFESLGFDGVDSLDYSDYQKCTIVHDLNENISPEYFEAYDLVFDGGTMEHVFNVPKVLENFSKLTKKGGRVIHAAPSSNHVDHGLYMFSPTLFVDYYSANKWDVIDTLLFEYKPTSNIGLFSEKLWNIYLYSTGSLDTWIFGGYSGMYGIFSVNKKNDYSITDGIVYQGGYRYKHNMLSKSDTITPEIQDIISSKTFIQRVAYSKQILSPELRDKIRPIYHRLANKLPLRFHLKRIARY
jgi:hypothetical protein